MREVETEAWNRMEVQRLVEPRAESEMEVETIVEMGARTATTNQQAHHA